MSRGPDAATLLERALIRSAGTTLLCATIIRGDWTRWASVTFTGARHTLTLQLPDTAVAHAWIARIGDCDLAMPGHVLADIQVVAQRKADGAIEIDLEALSVVDC